MPYFSVVIPTYNRADLLSRCIDSVLNQVYKDFEIIIVDNFSQDGTKELIDDYQKKDSRIRFIQEHNYGVIAHSRNVGIKAAKGQYIALLDSDDWFTEDKLQVVYNACCDMSYDVIYSQFIIMSEKGTGEICGRSLSTGNPFMELLVKGNVLCNSTVVVKKESMESVGFLTEDSELTAVEDIDGYLKLASTNHSFHFIKQPLVYYWKGDNNLSFSTKQIQRVKSLFEKWLPFVNDSEKATVIAGRDFLFGRLYHKLKDWKNARLCYMRVLKNPKSIKKIHAFVLLIFTYLHINR